MISLSNLLKQCYVVNSDGGKRIINSDQRLARSNSHNTDIDIHKELPIMPKLDGISAVPTGDPAKEIQKIKADAEKIERVEGIGPETAARLRLFLDRLPQNGD